MGGDSANSSSQFAPDRLSPVTLQQAIIVYDYDAATLWLAYGIAILFTLLAVAIGFYAIVANGASFTNDFSTIVRVTKSAELSVEIEEEDGAGKNPLPKYLEKARLGISAIK
jgi:hypothetical protein